MGMLLHRHLMSKVAKHQITGVADVAPQPEPAPEPEVTAASPPQAVEKKKRPKKKTE